MFLKSLVFTLLLIISLSSDQFKDCNFTDYRFQSKYNLGQQDELNTTFQALNGKISISDIVYPINSLITYSLTNINTSFQYLDSRQKAQIMGNDTILIDGGYLQTTLNMNWTRKDFIPRGGYVQAMCRSQEIMFTKNLTIQQGFLLYMVQQYFNVTFNYTDCKIIRYEPANTVKQDLDYVLQAINGRQDKKQTAKSQLAQEINKKYFYYLNNSLYNQKHHLDDTFVYEWNDTKGLKLQIQYQILPTGVDLQKIGLSFTFVTQIKDYSRWECGATIPHTTLDINKYGGIQQFVSLSVFQNTLKYGAEAGALDNVLTKTGWQSPMFQFFVGDLYQVIPSLSQNYIARQYITGSCKGNPQNISIVPEQKVNAIIVRTGHVCYLYIKGSTKLLQLHVDLFAQVQARFEQQAKVNFYMKGFAHSLSYIEEPQFKIENYQLANEIVKRSLDRLIGAKTFGSGWPTFKMDYPHLKVMAGGYVVFYDTSHVGTISKLNQKNQ